MTRKSASFSLDNIELFKQQVLYWANQYNTCCLLDSNQYKTTYSSYDFLLAVGCHQQFSITNYEEGNYISLKKFLASQKDWIFGHIAYEFGQKHSFKEDKIGFPNLFFFQPEIVLWIKDSELSIASIVVEPQIIFDTILKKSSIFIESDTRIEKIIPSTYKEKYIEIVNQIKKHIHLGDCYEINFCQTFYAEKTTIHPITTYQKLKQVSPNPFGAYYKLEDKYLLCASPERYIKKIEQTILSQPIKGTIQRNLMDKSQDDLLKKTLATSQKELSENVMIVDLVRNDLSRICRRASVKVAELFGIYSFPQVHQMISTIQGKVEDSIDFSDVLKSSFPMGSMTGAPKVKVMELIDNYENTKRGLYSGSVGYITPEKEFDFNVVIRSILYNEANQYIQYQVGSAITIQSNAEDEYEECLLKAIAMKKVLE